MKDIVNIVVVGLGPIGSLHVKNLLSQKIAGARLACICEQRGADSAQYGGVPIFTDLDEMLKSRSFDAAVISTPSFTHYPLAKKILQAGYDVLVEKPVALCPSDAEDLRETARKLGKVCAVMLNQRTNALYSKIRDLVVSGQLGEINRVSWTMTSWYRPNIYFTSSPWRGTWKGEAGGALVNQSIHNLDIFAWTFGVPEKLRAWCEFGKYHDIEVEDEVVCRMKLKNGANATFTTSTGEFPGENRLVIAADRGFIETDGDALKFTRYKNGSLSEYTRDTRYMFGSPECECTEEVVSDKGAQHAGVMQNFADALTGRDMLRFDVSEAMGSLGLANGMLMSAWCGCEVDFPLDGAKYKRLLDEKIAQSRLRENPRSDAVVEFSKSFK